VRFRPPPALLKKITSNPAQYRRAIPPLRSQL
jgi:hypothetical protein